MSDKRSIYIATRGSALALTQSNLVAEQCRKLFPQFEFELKVIKTSGDKLQTANPATASQEVSKGLFTKELEIAMLAGEADFAVHSLKDLPTDLPAGLHLAGVSEREDVRDVLIYRDESKCTGDYRGYPRNSSLDNFAPGASIATNSTRRQAQILACRSDLKTTPIRGNVGTRLRKLWEHPEYDATILALAGLKRLGYQMDDEGELLGPDSPSGTLAWIIPLEWMLPCVGQAALGFECPVANRRANDICSALNHQATFQAVSAERAFLRGMGGGCLSPVAAHGRVADGVLNLRAVSFQNGVHKRFTGTGSPTQPELLGIEAAQTFLR